MNQSEIGSFIAEKRKGKNLTQTQLAEIIGVSNKTVSKWENGKCMPDYSVIEHLCSELDISLGELLKAKEKEQQAEMASGAADQQVLELLERVQDLENQKTALYGILTLVIGLALLALSLSIEGSPLREFLSGLFLGISVVMMMVGLYFSSKAIFRNKSFQQENQAPKESPLKDEE